MKRSAAKIFIFFSSFKKKIFVTGGGIKGSGSRFPGHPQFFGTVKFQKKMITTLRKFNFDQFLFKKWEKNSIFSWKNWQKSTKWCFNYNNSNKMSSKNNFLTRSFSRGYTLKKWSIFGFSVKINGFRYGFLKFSDLKISILPCVFAQNVHFWSNAHIPWGNEKNRFLKTFLEKILWVRAWNLFPQAIENLNDRVVVCQIL